MGILKWVGVLLIVAWLLLWLVVEITFGTVHMLLLIGIATLLVGFLQSRAR